MERWRTQPLFADDPPRCGALARADQRRNDPSRWRPCCAASARRDAAAVGPPGGAGDAGHGARGRARREVHGSGGGWPSCCRRGELVIVPGRPRAAAGEPGGGRSVYGWRSSCDGVVGVRRSSCAVQHRLCCTPRAPGATGTAMRPSRTGSGVLASPSNRPSVASPQAAADRGGQRRGGVDGGGDSRAGRRASRPGRPPRRRPARARPPRAGRRCRRSGRSSGTPRRRRPRQGPVLGGCLVDRHARRDALAHLAHRLQSRATAPRRARGPPARAPRSRARPPRRPRRRWRPGAARPAGPRRRAPPPRGRRHRRAHLQLQALEALLRRRARPARPRPRGRSRRCVALTWITRGAGSSVSSAATGLPARRPARSHSARSMAASAGGRSSSAGRPRAAARRWRSRDCSARAGSPRAPHSTRSMVTPS